MSSAKWRQKCLGHDVVNRAGWFQEEKQIVASNVVIFSVRIVVRILLHKTAIFFDNEYQRSLWDRYVIFITT